MVYLLLKKKKRKKKIIVGHSPFPLPCLLGPELALELLAVQSLQSQM
jgi:hypothetical protein